MWADQSIRISAVQPQEGEEGGGLWGAPTTDAIEGRGITQQASIWSHSSLDLKWNLFINKIITKAIPFGEKYSVFSHLGPQIAYAGNPMAAEPSRLLSYKGLASRWRYSINVFSTAHCLSSEELAISL